MKNSLLFEPETPTALDLAFPHHQFLDARTFFCPEPLMLIRKELRSMLAGEVLLVFCDDPTAFRDVPNFCHFIGHRLLHVEQHASELTFWIQKKLS